ncbi:hypothetical protein ACWEVP_46870 [Amycolatopsis sp. NPDC003865]
MATNDRPARLALTAAVLALLLGGAGFLVQQRFATGPGGTVAVAGIAIDAPAGTRAWLREAPEPGAVPPLTRRFGGGADLAFDGVRPVRVRIPVPSAPPAGSGPVVLGGRTLVPAVYDAASRSIVAELTREGPFWGGLLDFAALGREVRPGPAPRPGCAGRSAGSDGLVVAFDAPDPAAPLSPCVTAGGGRASVTLTSNASVPYRIALPPGWPEPAARTVAAGQLSARPRQRDLLWPGTAVTYDVPFGRLPGTLRGQAEPGAAIGTTLAAATHRLAALFGMTDAAEPAPEVLACAADAGAGNVTADRPEAAAWAALASCHPAGGDVVRRFLAPGVGPVTAGLAAAHPGFAVTVTTSRAQRFTQTVAYQPRTAATTSRATGDCGAVSAVSGRHDAYRCTSGAATYDPCFAAAGPRVVCPLPAGKAVLLTHPGPLPVPPAPGGTPDPFLLTLAGGVQCAAVPDDPGTRFACADGTALPGALDTSGPLWTIDGRTVVKAAT